MKKEFELLYHVILGSLLITINLYFYIFVHYKYDLSPNFALGVITIPFAIREIVNGFKLRLKLKEEKWNN